MFLTTKSGRLVELPTPEEEAQINAGIAADPDTYELSEEWFKTARPAKEVLPPDLYARLTGTAVPKPRSTSIRSTKGLSAPLSTQHAVSSYSPSPAAL